MISGLIVIGAIIGVGIICCLYGADDETKPIIHSEGDDDD